MRKSLKIFWGGLVNAYDGAFQIILANLFWTILLMVAIQVTSLLDGAFFIIGILIILVIAAAGFAGLYYAVFQVASSEPVDWKTFFSGIRHYYWAGLRWTVFNGTVLFSMIFYFFLFLDLDALWAVALLGLDLGLMAFWILLQLITFPLMLKQEKPSFLTALRNALVFYSRWPGYIFIFALAMVFLIVVSLFLPFLFLFITSGLVAYLGSYAVYYRIESDLHPDLFLDPKHDPR